MLRNSFFLTLYLQFLFVLQSGTYLKQLPRDCLMVFPLNTGSCTGYHFKVIHSVY